MAKLRAYYLNGGDMLELVRYQKKEQPKAVGAEYDVLSGDAIKFTQSFWFIFVVRTESVWHNKRQNSKKGA